ncbi:unnamed protein product [Musa acuminata subsp. burmannicoides]
MPHCCSSKAETGKLSDKPVPVLKVIFPDEGSSTYISTTESHSSSSLVFTPVIFFIFRSSTKAVTWAAYDTCRLIFLKVCSFFLPCTSHMNPVSRLYPNSSMSSRGNRPLGRPSSSSSSIDLLLQMVSPR